MLLTIENLLHDKELLQQALTIDAINLNGLHKFVDFNLLDNQYKSLWFLLFTNYIPKHLAYKKEAANKRIEKSIYNDLLTLCNDEHVKLIVEYTFFRINHLSAINDTINNGELISKLAKEYYFNNPYLDDNNYPFLEYEDEQCYSTI